MNLGTQGLRRGISDATTKSAHVATNAAHSAATRSEHGENDGCDEENDDAFVFHDGMGLWV